MIDLATLFPLQPPEGLDPVPGLSNNAIKNSVVDDTADAVQLFAQLLQQAIPEQLPQTRIKAPALPLTMPLTQTAMSRGSGNSLPPSVDIQDFSRGNNLPPEIAPVPVTTLVPGLPVQQQTPLQNTVPVLAQLLPKTQDLVLPAKQAQASASGADFAPPLRLLANSTPTIVESAKAISPSEALPTVNGKPAAIPVEQSTVLAGILHTLGSNRTEHRERLPAIVRTAMGEQQPTQMFLGNVQQAGDAVLIGAKLPMSAMTLQTPMQHPDWAQSLAQRIYWMASQQQQGASIRLDPPELGTLEVRIHMDKEQASVMFTTPSAAVREAVEAALPRLREMFNHSGIELLDAGVKEQSQDQGRPTRDLPPQPFGDAVTADAEMQEMVSWGHHTLPQGLIDYYI